MLESLKQFGAYVDILVPICLKLGGLAAALFFVLLAILIPAALLFGSLLDEIKEWKKKAK